MHPHLIRIRLLVPVAAVVLLAAACSSADDEAASARPTAPAASASASASASQEPSPEVAAPTTPAPTIPAPTTPAAAPSAEAAAAPPATVTIAGFDYSVPPSVAAGAEVQVTNEDREAHTFTLSGGGGVQVVVPGGATVSVTAPAKAGRYPIVCDFHGGMTADLVVA